MKHAIRRADFSDAAPLADLLRAVGWFETINQKAADEAAEHVTLHLADCLADESHSLYVAADEAGRVVGYVSVHWLAYLFLPGPEGYISELFLHPDATGQGIGAALLETVRAEALARGACRLSLLNGKQRLSYQRGFYPKHGWTERSGMANFVCKLPGG